MQYPIVRLATAAALSWSAALAVAQTVTPPPLPPGSNLVRPTAGLNEDEKKRYVRAHHHKMQNKKDYTKDDSVAGAQGSDSGPGRSSGTQGAGSNAGAHSGGAAGATSTLGGAGTGPAREKTDKAASGYFFGNSNSNSNSSSNNNGKK